MTNWAGPKSIAALCSYLSPLVTYDSCSSSVQLLACFAGMPGFRMLIHDARMCVLALRELHRRRVFARCCFCCDAVCVHECLQCYLRLSGALCSGLWLRHNVPPGTAEVSCVMCTWLYAALHKCPGSYPPIATHGRGRLSADSHTNECRVSVTAMCDTVTFPLNGQNNRQVPVTHCQYEEKPAQLHAQLISALERVRWGSCRVISLTQDRPLSLSQKQTAQHPQSALM